MMHVWHLHICWWEWIPIAHGNVRCMFISGGNKHDIRSQMTTWTDPYKTLALSQGEREVLWRENCAKPPITGCQSGDCKQLSLKCCVFTCHLAKPFIYLFHTSVSCSAEPTSDPTFFNDPEKSWKIIMGAKTGVEEMCGRSDISFHPRLLKA